MRILARSNSVRAALGMVCFVAAFSYPVLARPGRIGVMWDWPKFLIRNWVATHCIRYFHQIPLWNPYECGGMPLLAHPSSQVVTPLFALPLIFGPAVASTCKFRRIWRSPRLAASCWERCWAWG